MSVEITLKSTEEPKKKLEFPILMQYVGLSTDKEELIVLFTAPTKGIALSSRLFMENDSWYDADDARFWKPFNGEITLKNKQ